MCACGNHSAKAKKPKCDWKEWRKKVLTLPKPYMLLI